MEPRAEGDPQDPQEQIQTEAERLALRLTEPLKATPPPPLASQLSESNTVLEILKGQSLRIDQMGKVLDLLASRMEATMAETAETMRLAQIVIAAQDKQLTEFAGMLDRLETTAQALVMVQGNLSEIVAELVRQEG